MKDNLAEQLLAKVMSWTEDDVASERPYLQAMAAYKYDEYQQFSPGMRFVESLACWLAQFGSLEEKQAAYRFVKNRLVFVSAAEMAHLVSTAYPDLIRPVILEKAAESIGAKPFETTRVAESNEFLFLRRQCLFLGMSDGAHTDIFRRASSEIRYEQVYQSYEITMERAQKMKGELRGDLEGYLQQAPSEDDCRFRMLFLLDDFSGSGTTYLRDNGAGLDGKIKRVHDQLTHTNSPLSHLFCVDDVQVFVVLYTVTAQAKKQIDDLLPSLWGSRGATPRVLAVYEMSTKTKLLSSQQADGDFLALCTRPEYYDHGGLCDIHTEMGGEGVALGFGECCLPLVLSHNTPNNSVALLWSYENAHFRGLFPRIPRHREIV